MSKQRIGLFLGSSAIIILAFFAYMGAFSSPKLEKIEAGPFHLVYVEYTGSYKDFTTIIKSVQNTMNDNGIHNYNAFGLFFDDPKFVPDANLRSYIGVIVQDEEMEKVKTLVDNKEVSYKILEPDVYISSSFPYRNFLSIFMGIMKVYPTFDEYGVANNFPTFVKKNTGYEDTFIMEIYKPDEVLYYMTLPKN
ncbi:MAG: GyrI-like domain-containing protein [Leptospirales bacterium]